MMWKLDAIETVLFTDETRAVIVVHARFCFLETQALNPCNAMAVVLVGVVAVIRNRQL
jgi:hypothetical protein